MGPASPTPATPGVSNPSVTTTNLDLDTLGAVRFTNKKKKQLAPESRAGLASAKSGGTPNTPDRARPAPAYPTKRKVLIQPTQGGLKIDNPSKKSKKSLPQIAADGLYSDKLGTLVQESIERLQSSDTWEAFVDESRGRPYLHEDVKDIDHPAASFLEDLRTNGVPAKPDDEDWTQDEQDSKFSRGAHQTAEMNRAFV